jgi:hypothetical protein
MTTNLYRIIGLMILISYVPAIASADSFVGIVKLAEAETVIQRQGEALAANPGTQVLVADRIETNGQGSAGVIFSDDTRVSMGPNTSIEIVGYQFAPKESKLSFVLRVIKGTVAFISGQITRLAPESVELIVPDATIGVRGTHVLIRVN